MLATFSIEIKKALETNNENQIIELLMLNISINTPITEKKLTSLHYAIKNKCSLTIIKLMLAAKADVSYLTFNKKNAFHYAAKRGDLDIMKILLKALTITKTCA